MRKILISILLVLLIVLAFFTIFQGISIGSFQVLSTEQIIALNDNLTLKIEEANRKIKSDLQNKKSELYDNVELLNENKESYYRVANVSTESEITEASTEEIYNWEYLYLRVGRHARQDGVNINMTAVSAGSADANLQNIHFITTDASEVFCIAKEFSSDTDFMKICQIRQMLILFLTSAAFFKTKYLELLKNCNY